MTKRLKIILSATAVFVVLTSGTIFGLAKTGVINIRMLADEIGIKSARTLTVSTLNSAGASANQTIKIYRKSQSTTTLGTLYNQKSISNSPGSADFSIESGYYYDAECVGSNVSPSLNIDATSGTSSLTSIVTCTANNNGGGGGTCTNNSNCNTNNGEWCNAQGQCSTTCTVGAQGQCPAGYSCNNGSCTNSNNNTCNANNCSAANGWTCQNNVCSNACTGSGQSTCPANFSCSNNQCTRNQVFTLTGKIQATSNGTTINLADTEVKLQANGKDPVSVRTDTNGNYTITNYPMASSNQTSGNSYTLTLTRAGYTTKSGTLTSFNLASLPTINTTYTVNTTMQASSTATVYGKVVKEDGSPVEGVTVNIKTYSGNPQVVKTISTTNQLSKPAGIPNDSNYIIYDLPRPQTINEYSSSYLIEIRNLPTGYIWDENHNGEDDADTSQYLIRIDPSDLVVQRDFTIVSSTPKKLQLLGTVSMPEIEYKDGIRVNLGLPNGRILTATSIDSNWCSTPNIVSEDRAFAPVRCNIYFDPVIIQSGRYSLSIENSENIYVVSGGNNNGVYEFTLDQNSLSSAVVTGPSSLNHYFKSFSFNLSLNQNQISKKFDFVAKVVEVQDPFAGMPIGVSLPQLQFSKTSISQNQYLWPGDSIDKKNVNLIIPDIPLVDDYQYKINLHTATINGITYSFVPGENRETFSSSDMVVDPNSGRNVIYRLYHVAYSSSTLKSIRFLDAETGQEINLNNENIGDNRIVCKTVDANEVNCQTTARIRSGSNSIVDYYYIPPTDATVRMLSLTFSSTNYRYLGGGIKKTDSTDVYLVRKGREQNAISCRTLDGFFTENVTFCTYKSFEATYFTPDNLVILGKAAKVLSELTNKASLSQLPRVFIYPDDGIPARGYATNGRGEVVGMPGSTYIAVNSKLLSSAEGIITTLIHEFGHVIGYGIETQGLKAFQSALYAARGVDEHSNPILNSSGQSVQSCNQIYLDYMCFSDYAITVNYRELWAEFFRNWVLNNDQIRNALASKEMEASENSHCYKALQSLNEIMLKSGFYAFEKLASPTSLNTESGKVAGTSTDPDAEFAAIMSEIGYKVSSPASYDSIGNILEMDLTPQQIADGVWLRSNYSKLPRTEKVNIQLGILKTRASNIIASNKTLEQARNLLVTINSKVDQLLQSIGISIFPNKIAGKVRDQDGLVSRVEVKIGNKYDTTASDGAFSITRIQTGEQKYEVSNPKIGKTYDLTPATITVAKNTNLSNKILQIVRPTYTFSGKILKGDQPLSNGKIIFSTGRVVNLDASGNFRFTAKEDQYKLTIKDNKNRTKTVTNPGPFGDLTKFNAISDITNGTIWVK